jgi:hypothetical protein
MTKRYKVILAIGAGVSLITAYSWLNWWVVPDVWVANLVPLKKTADSLPKEGSAIVFLKGSKTESFRVIESIEVGWDGILPVAIFGIIIGAISGSLFGYRLGYDYGYETGTPDREFIENAHKSFDHARELASKVEQKERYVEQRMEKAENLWSRSFQQNENASKVLKEYDRKMKEADKLLATAEKKFREAEANASELSKAQAKIRSLEGRIARHDKKKQKTIDEIGEED